MPYILQGENGKYYAENRKEAKYQEDDGRVDNTVQEDLRRRRADLFQQATISPPICLRTDCPLEFEKFLCVPPARFMRQILLILVCQIVTTAHADAKQNGGFTDAGPAASLTISSILPIIRVLQVARITSSVPAHCSPR